MAFEFVNVDCRFLFNNGKDFFTVEYATGLRMWFVFKGETSEDCLHKVKLTKTPKMNSITISAAQSILDEYLEKVDA